MNLHGFPETACDPTPQTPRKTIVVGFPDTKDILSVAIHPYFSIRYEL